MVKDGVEVILVRTRGGPHQGVRFMPVTKLAAAWPPPDEIAAHGGRYVKVSQSALTEGEAAHPNVARGAEYEWRGDGQPPAPAPKQGLPWCPACKMRCVEPYVANLTPCCGVECERREGA